MSLRISWTTPQARAALLRYKTELEIERILSPHRLLMSEIFNSMPFKELKCSIETIFGYTIDDMNLYERDSVELRRRNCVVCFTFKFKKWKIDNRRLSKIFHKGRVLYRCNRSCNQNCIKTIKNKRIIKYQENIKTKHYFRGVIQTKYFKKGRIVNIVTKNHFGEKILLSPLTRCQLKIQDKNKLSYHKNHTKSITFFSTLQ